MIPHLAGHLSHASHRFIKSAENFLKIAKTAAKVATDAGMGKTGSAHREETFNIQHPTPNLHGGAKELPGARPSPGAET